MLRYSWLAWRSSTHLYHWIIQEQNTVNLSSCSLKYIQMRAFILLVHRDLSIIIPLKQTLKCIHIYSVFPLTHFIDIPSHFHFFVYSFIFSVSNFFLETKMELLLASNFWSSSVNLLTIMPVYWHCLKTQTLSTTDFHIQISKVMTGIQKILGPLSHPTQLTSNCLSFMSFGVA